MIQGPRRSRATSARSPGAQAAHPIEPLQEEQDIGDAEGLESARMTLTWIVTMARPGPRSSRIRPVGPSGEIIVGGVRSVNDMDLRDRIHQAAGATRARRGRVRRRCASPPLASLRAHHGAKLRRHGARRATSRRPPVPSSSSPIGFENSSTLHCARPRVARRCGLHPGRDGSFRSSRRRQVGRGRVRPSEGAPLASHSLRSSPVESEASRGDAAAVAGPVRGRRGDSDRGGFSGPRCSPRRADNPDAS